MPRDITIEEICSLACRPTFGYTAKERVRRLLWDYVHHGFHSCFVQLLYAVIPHSRILMLSAQETDTVRQHIQKCAPNVSSKPSSSCGLNKINKWSFVGLLDLWFTACEDVGHFSTHAIQLLQLLISTTNGARPMNLKQQLVSWKPGLVWIHAVPDKCVVHWISVWWQSIDAVSADTVRVAMMETIAAHALVSLKSGRKV